MESQLYKGCPVQFTLQFLAEKSRKFLRFIFAIY